MNYTTNITPRHGDHMKQPTRQDTITIRIWKQNGSVLYENICGVAVYPLAIHRSLDEHEEILEGSRKRYSGRWHISHIPTGKGFGVSSRNWDDIVTYVNGIKDEPALLMVTDETMVSHPMYQRLVDKHTDLKAFIGY